MCFSCGGGWPWSQPVHLAAPPVKEEHVFLDTAYDFYPDYRTGLHHPAPIYQSNQPAQSAMYYHQGTPQAAGYYNNYYYGAAAPPATGWQLTSPSHYSTYPYPYSSYSPAPSTALTTYSYPYSSYDYSTCNYNYNYSPYYTAPPALGAPFGWPAPNPWCGQPAAAQAAAVLAVNSQLAAAPAAPYYFVGANPAEIQAQNAYIAANLMQMPQVPTQLVPFKPGSSQQFWVKELDGSWTLREHNDVIMGELGPGHWERHATSGYYYYVRHPA